MNNLIYILRGIPGSGKSTCAKRISNQYPTCICSADDYFVDETGKYNFEVNSLKDAHEYCFTKFRDSLSSNTGDIVVVDNTNTTIKEYERYYQLGIKYGIVSILRFECSIEESFARNTHNVPMDTIIKMYNRFENDSREILY